MILCPLCNTEFKNRRCLSCHLATTHKTDFNTDLDKERLLVYTIFGKEEVEKLVLDYQSEKYSIHELPLDISKYLSLLGIKRTSKEERKTERYKTKYLKSIQEKYGNDITNISQVKEVQKKKERTVSEKYGSYEIYLEHQRGLMKDGFNDYVGTEKHKNTVRKIETTCLERYGHSNFGNGKDALTRSKQTRKDIIAQWSYEERLERTSKARESVNHRGGYSSKPEKRVRKALIDLNVESVYNKHIWNYNWDMVIENILIEVQGVMWHAKPSKYKETDLIMGKILAKDIWEKDKRKHAKAKDEGYKVIEIWEDEIWDRDDFELCELVKERLIVNGYVFR